VGKHHQVQLTLGLIKTTFKGTLNLQQGAENQLRLSSEEKGSHTII
jgi:hypothetical protein